MTHQHDSTGGGFAGGMTGALIAILLVALIVAVVLIAWQPWATGSGNGGTIPTPQDPASGGTPATYQYAPAFIRLI